MRAVDASARTPSPGGEVAEPLEIRDAATVILVADRPDLHVLMLERTSRAVFGPGATVFPGGAVDPADRGARAQAQVVGLDDGAASVEHGLEAGGLGFRVAAVRECFEEAGILLARNAAGWPVDHDPGLATARDQLNAGAASFVDLLAARSLVIAGTELRLFSHWLTPIGAPRRYNTWFFVAPAPGGVDGAHDDRELVASSWVRPRDALAHHAESRIDLIFPTEMSLRALTRYERAADLLSDLDAIPRDDDGAPRVVAEGNGERVVLPNDTEHPTGRWTIPLPDISHRAERAAARGVR
jgi:8-oxo-dGTP pyrophosphatase MutT (NUDIX family)